MCSPVSRMIRAVSGQAAHLFLLLVLLDLLALARSGEDTRVAELASPQLDGERVVLESCGFALSCSFGHRARLRRAQQEENSRAFTASSRPCWTSLIRFPRLAQSTGTGAKERRIAPVDIV